MKALLIAGTCLALSLSVVSLKAGEMNQQTCRKTIAGTCTKCHGAARICKKLKDGDMNADKWRTIIARMGRRAKLSRDVQNSIHACLTTSANPGKLVCN